ncbi:cytochrome c1, partial [Salmonella enterica subsp. enterica serovar Reading]|nr:cytochrome c1 [Salmonella enterica subsp. enterica serovar Reading]
MRQLLRYRMLWIVFFAMGSAFAQDVVPTRQNWSFSGLTGHYDKEQLRRGLQVYEEKCRACHSMKYLTF